MSYAAAFPLYGAVLLLAVACFYRAFRLLTAKPDPQGRREQSNLSASFWEHVFGRRRVKRLSYHASDANQPL